MDDVRVRLSAEGINEVVGALRKVAAESKRTAEGADSSFKQLNHTLEATKQLMESFWLLKIMEMMKQLSDGIVDFGKATLKAAVEQKELAQTVGTTVGRFSALSAVAVLAKVKSEVLVAGLGHLGKSIDDLKNGVPAATTAFARLHLAAKNFPSNDIAVNAEKVARAFSEMADGQTKSAIAAEILGQKGGRALLPFFNKLMELKGLSGAINLAQRSGFYVGDVAIAQLEEMDMKFKVLQVYAQGAALAVYEGFGPSLIEVLDSATVATGSSRNAFEKFGEVIGVVLRVARATVMVGLVPLVETMTLLIESVKKAHQLTQLIRAGAPLSGVIDFARVASWQIGRDLDKIQENAGQAVLDIFRKPAGVPAAGEDPRAAGLAAQQAAQERLNAAREEANSEVQLLQERNRRLEEADAQLYAQGKLSLQQYFSNRNDRINSEYAADLRLLAIRREAALAEPDPVVRGEKIATIDNERAAREEKYKTQALQFLEEYRAKRLAIVAEINAAEDRARAAQGQTLEAALRQADLEEQKLREDLVKAYQDPALAAAEAKRVGDIERAGARFRDLLATANHAMEQFATDREKIELLVTTHAISQAEGNRRIAVLEADRLPKLREIAGELKNGAEALGPDAQLQVEQFGLKVEKLKAIAKGLGTDLREGFQEGLTSFLASGINQVHNLIDAFRQLGLAIAQAVQQKIAARLGGDITDFIFSGLHMAEGGLVTGPGGPRDDRIPARLSAGEFIVPADVVSRPGVLAGLEALRSEQFWAVPVPHHRRYADGGLVAPAQSSARMDGRITVELSEGLIGKIIEHPKFSHGVLRTVAKNPRSIRGMLG